MPRDYAAVPHEYLKEMSCLSDAQFGRLIRALLRYSEAGEPIALSGNERFYIDRVTAEEDRHKRSYERLVTKCSIAGKASARARQSTNVNMGQPGGETETKTETEKEGLFSIEKKPSRGCAAKKKRDDSWMNEYD